MGTLNAARQIIASVVCAMPVFGQADRITVPLIVENNRPFVQVTFRKPDGSTHVARFLLDTGGGGFLLTEPLALALGLKTGEPTREEGTTFSAVISPLAPMIGNFPLELLRERTFVVAGSNVLPPAAGAQADGMIPGHVLSKYHVIFDYPARQFTIAKAGTVAPAGDVLPMPIGRTGFPRTEIEIDGVKHGLLLDTGASFTMVSEVFLCALGSKHPAWQRDSGAVGDAKTLGGATLETMTVASGHWGNFALSGFGITSQREGTFERYMTNMMAAPIVGSLAGNVLKQFRVELDYANQKLYLSTK
jgi:hypothetical protein